MHCIYGNHCYLNYILSPEKMSNHIVISNIKLGNYVYTRFHNVNWNFQRLAQSQMAIISESAIAIQMWL